MLTESSRLPHGVSFVSQSRFGLFDLVEEEIHKLTLPQLSLILQHGAETYTEVRKIPALSVSRQLSMNHYMSTRWSEQSARSPWVHRITWPQ